MSLSTTGSNSANLRSEYYVKKLLAVLQPRLQVHNLGRKTALPKGESKTAKWLQYTKISSSVTPLSEGTNPAEISFTTANVTATIAQFGQFAKVSDLLETTAIDPVVEQLAELFGKAGAETLEDLCIAQLDSALTIRYVNGRANADAVVAGDVINMKEFLKAMIDLKSSCVSTHESGKYVAVLHAASEYDLITESNLGAWQHMREQAAQDSKGVMAGEIGSLYGIRFIVSDKMTAADNSGSVNVKKNYLLGEECFGVVDLGGKGVEIIEKSSESGGQANPLNMYGTVGYKIKGYAAKAFASGARGRQIRGTTSFA